MSKVINCISRYFLSTIHLVDTGGGHSGEQLRNTSSVLMRLMSSTGILFSLLSACHCFSSKLSLMTASSKLQAT